MESAAVVGRLARSERSWASMAFISPESAPRCCGNTAEDRVLPGDHALALSAGFADRAALFFVCLFPCFDLIGRWGVLSGFGDNTRRVSASIWPISADSLWISARGEASFRPRAARSARRSRDTSSSARRSCRRRRRSSVFLHHGARAGTSTCRARCAARLPLPQQRKAAAIR
jgi:hypothetical protein